jgi:hypothetical protein
MYWMGVHLDKIAGSQRAGPPRQSASSLFTHAFQAPKTGTVGQHRKRSSEGAFALQRRCFERERRGSLPGPVKRRLTGRKLRDCVSHACGPISAKDGVATILSLKASSPARGAALTQVRGRMSSVPLRKAMPPMTPAARSCAGTAANRLYDPPCVWLTLRAPGSSNAPLLARSRPTQVFLRCRLAETPMMWGVTGSAMSPPASNGYCVPRKESENE